MFTRCLAALIALIALALPLPSHADTQGDKVHELLQLMGVEAQSSKTLDALWPQIEDMVRKSNNKIPPDVLDEILSASKLELNESYPSYIKSIEVVYRNNLSDKEVDALLAFYRSPEGRSFIAKQATMTSQIMSLVATWSRDMSKRLITRIANDLHQKGYDLHPPR